MKLTVETLNAKVQQSIVLDVELDSQVLYVKHMIHDRTNIAFDNQMLLADGQVLCDSLSLIDCDFIGDRTIHLLLIDEYMSKFMLDESFKVTVKIMSLKDTELEVRSGDRIKDLKIKLQEQEGIASYLQDISFDGRQPGDEQTLFVCGIKEGSVIYLSVHSRTGSWPISYYHLQFRTLTGKTISMSGGNETVQTVIERVWKLEGIRAGNQLTFNNEPLDNEKEITMTDSQYAKCFQDAYEFEQDSILVFRNKPCRASDDLKVYVKFPGSKSRKMVRLIVKAVHSVQHLKSAIGSRAGARVENLKLAVEDLKLEDHRKLSDYAVQNEMVLHATLKRKLFVKRLDDGMIFRLEVDTCDRIENVKERIHHQERLPTDMQVLSLGTCRLTDDELVDGICFKSKPPVLGLEVKLVRDLQIVINPNPWPVELRAPEIGPPISLSIKSNETIGVVKSMIAKPINRSPDLHLYFNGEQLVDSCTFDQLGVRDRVCLSFAHRTNAFKISIVPIGADQSKIEVQVDAHDTIKYLKSKIERSTDWLYGSVNALPSDRQILTYEGRLLEDDRTLLNYGIGAGSEVSVSLRVVELEVTVQTKFVERRVLKVRSDCTWQMFVSEIKKLGLSICLENDCSPNIWFNPKDLSKLIVREPLMIKQTVYCKKCPGCARIQAFKLITGWN